MSSWTNNVSERGAKAAKRHQAVLGYWHSLATLTRWCRIRSHLGTARRPRHHRTRRHQQRPRRKTWLPPLQGSGVFVNVRFCPNTAAAG